jgi:uncharacterized membrane protein YbhN (UPF0104 family)
MTMMKAAQYYMLSGRQASYPRVLSIVVTQNIISNFIATGAGIASYLTMFSVEEGIRLRKAAATFLIAKVGDLIAVWAALLITSLLLWREIPGLKIAAMIMLVMIPLAIGLFLGVIILRQRFVDLAGRLAKSSRLDSFPFIQRGLEILQFVAEQDEKYVFGLVQMGAVCSIIYMALTMLWAYASLRAYSVDLSASVVVFVNSWIQLISWLPIQVFGGLGVAETSQVYLYGIFGTPAAQMATVSVGLRVILYLFNLISLLYIPAQAFFRRKDSL